MKVCSRCGKKMLFSGDSLCSKCKAEIEAEKRLETENQIAAAKDFIIRLQDSVRTATEHTVILPQRGWQSIHDQYEACKAALKGIEQWQETPQFAEAFMLTSRKSKHRGYENDCLPHTTLFSITEKYNEEEVSKAFQKLKTDIWHIEASCISNLGKAYDYSEVYRVAGVTFKNGRRHRQTILREIRFKDCEYRRDPEIRLERYLYEGREAIAVYANNEQVGNIPEVQVPALIERWDDYIRVSEFDIHGGKDTSYGMDIRVCFRKNSRGNNGQEAEKTE